MGEREYTLEELQAMSGNSAPKEYSLAELEQMGKPEISKLESTARGAAQGALLGFPDEIAGAGGAIADVLGDKATLGEIMDRYRANRDESRKAFEESEKANPKSYMGGQLGGGVATALIPGLGVAKAAKLATAVGKGALGGGIAGLGSTEADLTDPTLGNVAQAGVETATGAALGGLLGGGAQKLLRPSKALKDTGISAARSHLRATPGVAARLGDKLDDVAETTLKRQGIRYGETAKSTANNLEMLKTKIGRIKGKAVDRLTQKGAEVPGDDLLAQLDDTASVLGETATTARDGRRIGGLLDDFRAKYSGKSVSLYQLEKEKSALQNLAKKAYGNKESSEYIQGVAKLARTVKEAGERAAEETAAKTNTGSSLKRFVESKKTLTDLFPAENMARETGALTDGGLMSKMTDVSLLNVALKEASQGNLMPLAILPVRGLTKGRVASTSARGLYDLGTKLGKTGNVLGGYAEPVAGAATRSGSQLELWKNLLGGK